MSTPAILVRELKKFYGSKAAVDGVDLEVPRGSFFGFLGPNGAGKSTTIRMLTGLIPADSGSIEILGFHLPEQDLEIKRRIGLVPDESLLFDRLTGAEFLEFVGRMYGLDRATAIERARDLLELFELQADRKMIGEYSKGMRKRVAMAASLIHHPELFLMDEPFEGVDAVGARLMKDILIDQVKRGATIFLTSHVLEVVERLCDRVAIINNGRIVNSGTLEDLRVGRRIAGGRIRPPGGRRPPDGAAGLVMIAAILRAQMLSMRLGASRGALFGILTGVLWYGLWTGAAVAACVLALEATASRLHAYLPLVFLGICGYWQIIPVLSASMGSGPGHAETAALPRAAREAVPGGGSAPAHHGSGDGAGAHRRNHRPAAQSGGRRMAGGAAPGGGSGGFRAVQPAAGLRHAEPSRAAADAPQSARGAELFPAHALRGAPRDGAVRNPSQEPSRRKRRGAGAGLSLDARPRGPECRTRPANSSGWPCSPSAAGRWLRCGSAARSSSATCDTMPWPRKPLRCAPACRGGRGGRIACTGSPR